MKYITSKDNKIIKETVKLKDGKSDLFIVEGFHLVEMAIKYDMVKTIFTVEDYESPYDTIKVPYDILKKIASSKNPQGILAVCYKKKPNMDITSRRVLVLDEVNDPGNVGTLLRSALAFGFHDVLLLNNCASPYKYMSISASQGAIFGLNIIESNDSYNLIKSLKEDDYSVIGTDLKSSYPLSQLDNSSDEKVALILGNEARGVSKQLLSLTDKNVIIEIKDIDSLNVAMAGSIILYYFRNN